ncbi:hypothetical protein L1887_61847 [Cichorium endivia]|nr:hypothetical protein L1887_61847 [Cichorium endivia]
MTRPRCFSLILSTSCASAVIRPSIRCHTAADPLPDSCGSAIVGSARSHGVRDPSSKLATKEAGNRSSVHGEVLLDQPAL